MTRIIAGSAGGRRLVVPPKGTRPTTDRVREALFSRLDARLTWPGLVVLDLYAGSGALGLEALSRGAERVVLVEQHAQACVVIQRNIEAVGIPGATLVHTDVGSLPGRAPICADLVLADPPYEVDSATIRYLLVRLLEAGWLAPDADVVVERPTRDQSNPLPDGWSSAHKAYGETSLWYGQVLQLI
jgi:16S rRNA (guanine966-N2)-methyltransferase